jgi:hypothetical protein
MGLFDSIGNVVKNVASDIGKGVKRGAGKVIKGAKRNVFSKGFGKGFMRGMRTVGRALQLPAKTIQANDPLAKKMGGAGFLSPISLGTDIALAPITGIGYLEELAGDRGLQKKLASGDPNTIIDTAFAGLSLVPMSGASKVAKKLGRGAKGTVKKVGRALGSAIGGLF